MASFPQPVYCRAGWRVGRDNPRKNKAELVRVKRKASAEGGEEISAEAFAKGGDSDELKEVSVTRLHHYLTQTLRVLLPKNIIRRADKVLKIVMTLRNEINDICVSFSARAARWHANCN
ncbi:MAG TPA: hypothetical protein VFF68_10695 [Anaerolineaceae bacterium]|nr:hypothetical protein [Anaerolineaceae bacterium]